MRRKLFSLLTAIFMATIIFSAGGSLAAADRRPYFKAYGGDIMTGGWFTENNACDTGLSSKYQDGRNSADNIAGGIMSYTKSTLSGAGFDAAGGSSSQFAAYILGKVDNDQPSNKGFYSNGAGGGAVAGRTFANNSLTPWGGSFQDDIFSGIRQSYCIADYYSKKPTPNPPGIPTSGKLTNGTGSGVYYVDGSASPYEINDSDITLNPNPSGLNITIYVNGDAYIGGNITYNDTAPTATVNNIAKFAIVAKGSIYIGPNVTNLYGFYAAQPDPANINAVTDDDGVIWTCHPNNTAPVLYTWPATNCTQKLTITGALAAKQVNFLRVNGSVEGANTAEDPLGGMGSANIAEVINYNPYMPLGGPFFVVNDVNSIRNKIDSLISLPPIF